MNPGGVLAERDLRLPTEPPKPGQLVRVRQRIWLVEGVTPDPEPDSSRVRLACAEDDAQGEELEVFWDCEPDRQILDDERWSDLGRERFDPPRHFAAYLNTLRWNSVTATDPSLLQAPFRAGIKLDAYQMEPLRMAMAMPRVRLFIADDTGLGKTIEAGLIARELLLRKKIETIVVAAPASVLEQWRAEMEERFGLGFRILDRHYFARMRIERGFGVNPWRTHSRFLVSHNLLRSDTYAAPMREWLGERLRASLLILDEAHHAAPARDSAFGIESKFTRAIREIGSRFEHRLFLSATPHNGHSHSFSTLMELLDPVRFTRGVKVTGPQAQAALRRAMVRRLKDDVRQLGVAFPKRIVEAVVVDGLPEDAPELVLSRLLDRYRDLRADRFRKATKKQQSAAALVTIGLQQRLLSSIEAFSRSLERHRKTVARQHRESLRRSGGGEMDEGFVGATGPIDEDDSPSAAPRDEAELAAARAEEERAEEAWETAELAALNRAAEAGRERSAAETRLWKQEQDLLDQMERSANPERGRPDAKTRKLLDWIRENLCPGLPPYGESTSGPPPRWNDRRVLIFTENRQGTKVYLRRVLQGAIEGTDRAADRIAVIDGLVAGPRRREIQRRFNAPPAEDPLRILLATDAAREGLNFQAHCTDLFHFDLPWNPGRIEQRNGRIDRRLQPAPEVRCRYFTLPQRKEDRVLEVLVRKTETIQRELGSLAKVIDDGIERRLRRGGIRHKEAAQLAGWIGQANLDAEQRAASREELAGAKRPGDQLAEENARCQRLLERSGKSVGLEETAFRDALSCALEIMGADPLRKISDAKAGRPQEKLWEFPSLRNQPGWDSTLDALRVPQRPGQKLAAWREDAPVRPIAFRDAGRLTDDRVHLHLEHRVARRLLSRFRSQGFVHHDLSRACLVQTADAVPRVVLLGRLFLFGHRAERLHEQLVFVTARWSASSARPPLQPYRRDAHRYTLRLLMQSLRTRPSGPGGDVESRLRNSAAQDVADLLPHLGSRAKGSASRATRRLRDRGKKEAEELTEALRRQQRRVRKELRSAEENDPTQQRKLSRKRWEREKHERAANLKAWRQRIAQFDRELESEPRRIRDFYRVRANRFEPVGLAYLWPTAN